MNQYIERNNAFSEKNYRVQRKNLTSHCVNYERGGIVNCSISFFCFCFFFFVFFLFFVFCFFLFLRSFIQSNIGKVEIGQKNIEPTRNWLWGYKTEASHDTLGKMPIALVICKSSRQVETKRKLPHLLHPPPPPHSVAPTKHPHTPGTPHTETPDNPPENQPATPS